MDGVVVKILNGTFNMYGGEITPGTCTDSNGSNCITVGDGTKNSVLNVQGGTIKGEITLNSASAKVSIGGDAKVGIEQNGKAYGIGTASAVTSAVNVTCKDVTAEGKVVLKDTDYLGVTGTGDERAFTIIDPHNKVVDNSNGEGIGTLSIVARMCVCGAVGEHTQVGGCGAVSAEAWKPWNSAISIAKDKANGMSGRVMLPATTGKYYLTENMSLTTQTAITGSNAVHLDLAGYAATMSSNNNIYRMQGGTLDIADSSANKTGKLESLYTGGDNAGYVIILQSSSTVKIYNVKLMAKSAQKLADTWGLVVARNAGNFAMYGGSIEGNPSSGASSIRATNTSNMYAGINLKDVSLDGVITNKTNW